MATDEKTETVTHTPGPWHVEQENGPKWNKGKAVDTRRFHVYAGAVRIATLDDNREDARLIAAAPTLLAIVQSVDAFVRGGECCPLCSEFPHRFDCSLVAAVAKAEGR